MPIHVLAGPDLPALLESASRPAFYRPRAEDSRLIEDLFSFLKARYFAHEILIFAKSWSKMTNFVRGNYSAKSS